MRFHPNASAMLLNNFFDHAVVLGLFGIHDEIPLDVFLDALNRLAAVLSEQLVDHSTHAQNLLGVQIDVRGLAAETGEPWLMNKDARVGQSKALFRCATSKENGGDGGGLSDAGGNDVGLHELHGVIDSESGSDGAARRIDIELDIALGIFGLEEEHLCGSEVGDVIVDRRANEDDVLFEEPRVDVIGAFATARVLDHHGYKCCCAISWVVVKIFHVRYVSGQARTAVSLRFCCGHRANSGILCEPIESFITPQLSFHPIEGTLLCQTSANCFGGLATMRGRVFELVIELFAGYVDVFGGSDAVDNQFRFNIVGGAFFLTAAQGDPVDVYGSGIDTLRGQRAHNTLEAHIHLMLHQRFGHGKIVKLDNRGENLLAQEFFVTLVAGGFEALAKLGLQLVERAGVADVLGKFVVQLG